MIFGKLIFNSLKRLVWVTSHIFISMMRFSFHKNFSIRLNPLYGFYWLLRISNSSMFYLASLEDFQLINIKTQQCAKKSSLSLRVECTLLFNLNLNDLQTIGLNWRDWVIRAKQTVCYFPKAIILIFLSLWNHLLLMLHYFIVFLGSHRKEFRLNTLFLQAQKYTLNALWWNLYEAVLFILRPTL